MNETFSKADAGAGAGKTPAPPVASRLPEKPAGNVAARSGGPPPLPSVTIGKPGYKFQFPVDSPQGADERREHERIRKADRRAAFQASQPPPLPAPPMVDTPPTPGGELGAGNGAPGAPVVVEVFIPWVGADVADFTDELVELTETKRVADFVKLAREAQMPAKFISEVEKRSHYPTQSKSALKRTLADCAAKWLNKTGVSSKNKEEVKLLFCVVTIKLQGVRLKKDLQAMIAEDVARRAAQVEKKSPDPLGLA